MGAIADNRQIHLDILIDAGGVDIDVDFLGIGGECIQAAGDAVVKPRTDADHQVAIMHDIIRLISAVHPQHPQPLLVGGRIRAQPHQRGGDGKAGHAHQFAQQHRGIGAGIDDAAAGVKHRLFRLGHQVNGMFNGVQIALDLRLIGLVMHIFRPRIGAGGKLHVLGNINQHRARAAGARHIKGLMQYARQIGNRADQIIMLGAGTGDAGGVTFLKGIRADEVGWHLSGDAHQRNRIHQSIGERGDSIGGTGAGGDEQNTHLAGGTGIAFCRMAGTLLMTHQHMLDVILLENRIINRQNRAAGIAENRIDALILQSGNHHFRSGHLL